MQKQALVKVVESHSTRMTVAVIKISASSYMIACDTYNVAITTSDPRNCAYKLAEKGMHAPTAEDVQDAINAMLDAHALK